MKRLLAVVLGSVIAGVFLGLGTSITAAVAGVIGAGTPDERLLLLIAGAACVAGAIGVLRAVPRARVYGGLWPGWGCRKLDSALSW